VQQKCSLVVSRLADATRVAGSTQKLTVVDHNLDELGVLLKVGAGATPSRTSSGHLSEHTTALDDSAAPSSSSLSLSSSSLASSQHDVPPPPPPDTAPSASKRASTTKRSSASSRRPRAGTAEIELSAELGASASPLKL
jgi:hypothetical protein